MRKISLLIAVLAVGAACHKKQSTTVASSGPVTPLPAPAPTKAVTPAVAVSGDLAHQCRLHFSDVATAPKFGYDEFELLPEDRAVLEQVATCVTTGPLKGRSLRLVGRTDPRGTDEYNLGLGDRRANTVQAFLQRLGVAPAQVATATRGALDATGGDEASWHVDRRVDVELRN